MTIQRSADYGLPASLMVAGLLSGLITAGLLYPIGQSQIAFLLFPGFVLGLLTFACFLACGITLSAASAVSFVGGSTVSYTAAVGVASITEVLTEFAVVATYSFMHRSRPQEPLVYLSALFAGGTAGAFVIFTALLHVLFHNVKRQRRLTDAFYWSLGGGILAVIGWKLGSSLGMALWVPAHALGLTAPGETVSNALYGQSSHRYSLFVIWEAGIGFLLGLVTRKYQSRYGTQE